MNLSAFGSITRDLGLDVCPPRAHSAAGGRYTNYQGNKNHCKQYGVLDCGGRVV